MRKDPYIFDFTEMTEPYKERELKKAFSRSTYQSVYIIDYFKRNFLYVSPNPMFLCGLSPEHMMDLGYDFYLKYVPEGEQPLLLELNRAGFAFQSKLPLMKGTKISINEFRSYL